MWIEIDNVVIKLDAVTSFVNHIDESLIIFTTSGEFEFYDNCNERCAKLKEILFGDECYDYDSLKM